MRWTAIVCFLIIGCHAPERRADEPAARSSAEAATASDGYCRARGTFEALPLGTVSGSNLRPAHTFSIVARDPATGDLGVAVQSHWFSVGVSVAWAEAGVGAVATQSFTERSYGPKGLALMREGTPAAEAMAQLIAQDPASAVRQLGFVDAQGRAAAHTGARCIQYAGHHIGDGYTVQSNMMGNDKVVPAMTAAFESAKGDLADRMLAALDAAQEVGGDIRGCQSAALVMVSGKKSAAPWAERKIDLRVDDARAPLAELHRLVTLARAYDRMNKGDAAIERGDMKAAVDNYGAAAAAVPDNAEMIYWQGVALASHGEVERSLPLFEKAFAADPAWRELTRRLPAAGILPDQATAERVLSGGR
jgi:uncharacterized Ntn-hydrolase superfamily protein